MLFLCCNSVSVDIRIGFTWIITIWVSDRVFDGDYRIEAHKQGCAFRKFPLSLPELRCQARAMLNPEKVFTLSREPRHQDIGLQASHWTRHQRSSPVVCDFSDLLRPE